MTYSKLLMPSVLMVAISTVMVGCGGGSSGESSSSSPNNGNSGTNNSNSGSSNDNGTGNGNNNPDPKPVTCSDTQYLQDGVCKNKGVQTFQPPKIKRFLKGQAYQLNLKTDQQLELSLTSNSPSICTFEDGELKALDLGQCSIKLTQSGTKQFLPLNSNLTVDVLDASTASQKDLNACEAGRPSEADRQLFINTLNEIRALHQLPRIQYDYAHEDQMMQASMLLAVNEKTSHFPDSTWVCFSDIGFQGTSTSNLNFIQSYENLNRYGADQNLVNWLTEKNSVSIGHRRYILSPFLTKE